MLQVNHQLTIGSAVFKSGDRTRLVDLRSSAALDIPVNTCRIVLKPPDDLAIAADDLVKVELGDTSLSLVFTGKVNTVDWQIDRVIIHAAGAFQRLLSARFNLVYEKSKAGDIVSDVSDRLKLSSGTVDSGVEFPAYALGDSDTSYNHLRRLAQQCGFDFYADTQDQVIFTKFHPAETHDFQYGVNIIALSSQQPAAQITGVEVYGESPTSFGQGSEAYPWFTKKDVQGKAGDASGLVRRWVDPTARTLDLAGQIATALLETQVQKQQGILQVLGTAAVKLGDAIKISGMPVAAQNGVFRVIQVIQTLNASRGFCTSIYWEER
jgi:phage protein D